MVARFAICLMALLLVSGCRQSEEDLGYACPTTVSSDAGPDDAVVESSPRCKVFCLRLSAREAYCSKPCQTRADCGVGPYECAPVGTTGISACRFNFDFGNGP